MSSPALGLVEVPVRPFRWLANILGGLLFGVGMILSGGCSGSTWYRVGEGAIGAWVILLGFAMGATTANVGALAPLRSWLQSRELELRLGDAPPTLPSALGLPPWLVIAVLGAAALIWLARGPREPEHGKWAWPLTGAAVGRPDRGGLVDVHSGWSPRRHHLRGEHRARPHLPAGGLSQPGHVEHGAAARHAARRLSRRLAGGRFPLEASRPAGAS